ncbi:DUF2530 domain-containing protein [Streptosporangium sandarakinum]|uniref:DUF2530 domain-containing protein n=1 Tax=Streptosporangium sandarakinum TaxID=1260955 RepID=UPI0034129E80
MKQSRPSDLQPLKTNDTATILTGIGLWAAALVALLIIGPDAGHRWWIWTCVSGICGGVFGLWFVRRRDRHAPASAPAPGEEPVEPATAIPPVSPTPPPAP